MIVTSVFISFTTSENVRLKLNSVRNEKKRIDYFDGLVLSTLMDIELEKVLIFGIFKINSIEHMSQLKKFDSVKVYNKIQPATNISLLF